MAPESSADGSSSHRAGLFIVLEGGEGCGKSTQARALAERRDALLTHEPGDTPVGERIRAIVLDPDLDDLDPRAEALMMAADRAHHVATVVRPALAAGRDVVSDRYLGSSVAYQGFGRDLGAERIADLSRWATAGLEADLVVLLDLDPEIAAGRIGRQLDRLEAEAEDFHRRVRAGFLEQAAADPAWVVIDADQAPERVEADIARVVAERLDRR